jgi:hypothetical protein
MSGEDDRYFYQMLNMVHAIIEYLDADGFEDCYAKAETDQERFIYSSDLAGRLAAAVKQFAFFAGPSETDAAIPFKGWSPAQYEAFREAGDYASSRPTSSEIAMRLGLNDPAKVDRFYAGWHAFWNIQSDASNPYPDDSADFEAWSDGYSAAESALEARAAREEAKNFGRELEGESALRSPVIGRG